MPLRKLDGFAQHLYARWGALSPGEKLFVLWLTPGVPPPGPFGREEVRERAMMHASAYVQDGRLYVMGVKSTPIGTVPFSYQGAVDGSVPDGPIDLFSKEHPETVLKAVEEAKRPIMSAVAGEAMKMGAESLVERSRSGDQNAMAILTLVAENAEKGNKRAKHALKLVKDYIGKHPMEGGTGNGPDLGRAHGEDDSISRGVQDSCGAEFGAWHDSLKHAVFGGESDAGDKQAVPTTGVVEAIKNVVTAPVAPIQTVSVVVATEGKESLKMLAAAAAPTETPLKYGAAVASLVSGVGASVGTSLAAASALANGRPVDATALKATAGALPSGDVSTKDGQVVSVEAVFKTGLNNASDRAKIQILAAKLPTEGKQALQVGFVLGIAQKIQAVREGKGFLSDMAEWELGTP